MTRGHSTFFYELVVTRLLYEMRATLSQYLLQTPLVNIREATDPMVGLVASRVRPA
jgi:hypothetical protein